MQILETPFLGQNGFRKLLPRQMFRSREIELKDRELNILIVLESKQSENIFNLIVLFLFINKNQHFYYFYLIIQSYFFLFFLKKKKNSILNILQIYVYKRTLLVHN